MPKQPRSKNRGTAAFDPSELADLIHIPAVGRGVSSHLLSRSEPQPAFNMTTEVISDLTTVAISLPAQGHNHPAADPPAVVTAVPTHTRYQSSADQSTVVMSPPPPGSNRPTSDLTTVVTAVPAPTHNESPVDQPTEVTAPLAQGHNHPASGLATAAAPGPEPTRYQSPADQFTVVMSPPPSGSNRPTSDLTTVVTAVPAPTHNESPVDQPTQVSAPLAQGHNHPTSRLATAAAPGPEPTRYQSPADQSTVVMSPPAQGGLHASSDLTTGVECVDEPELHFEQMQIDVTTEVIIDLTTVVTPVTAHGPLWISESGHYVIAARVRPHISATDALSDAEKAIYHLLRNRAVAGSAQAGYQTIMQETGLSKKTVQRTIDKLLEKDFLEIAVPGDSHHRTPTTYKVFPKDAVLARHQQRGRRYIAQIGPGVAFVRPVDHSGHV